MQWRIKRTKIKQFFSTRKLSSQCREQAHNTHIHEHTRKVKRIQSCNYFRYFLTNSFISSPQLILAVFNSVIIEKGLIETENR